MIPHPTPEAMARCLVGYIKCDKRVQREIRAEFFSNAMPLSAIAAIRAARNAPEKPSEPIHPADAYNAAKASDELRGASAALAARMLNERRKPRLRVEAA